MATFDDHKNFAGGITVTVAPSPAASGTSMTVSDGTVLPNVPFNLVVYPADAEPLTSNAEIVRVTANASGALTIVRTQEGTSARTIVVGDQCAAAITDKTLTDLESAIVVVSNTLSAEVSARTAAVNTVSHLLSVAIVSIATVSNAVSVEAAARIASDDTISNAVSIVSQALSVANASLSNLISAHNALSNRVSANSGTGGSGSVTSNELSAAGASLAARIDTTSNLVSALTSAHNALSNQVSNLISAGGGGTSVTSNELSAAAAALSSRVDTASALATTADTHAATASAAATSVDARVNTLSNLHSVLSQAHSALSVNVQTVSNAASNALSVANAASNAASIVSVAAAAADTHANTASAAATSVDARVNTVSNAASVVSVAAAAADAHAGAASAAATSANARISAASAVNAIGVSVEGLQSALGALSDRISVVSRVDFFPTTPILDDFNRANEGPPPSANWGTIVGTGHKVLSNQMVPDSNANHTSWWTAQTFGPDIEVYLTIVTKSGDGFNVDIGWIDASVNGYEVIIKSESGIDTLTTYRLDAGVGTQLGIVGREITNGDRYGFRSLSGVHTVLVSPNGSAMWYELASYTDTTHSVTTAKLIVATKDGTAVCDNFGGGNCLTTANVASVVSNALSVANAASNAASIVSQALSVQAALLSNLTSAHNVLSNRVSANSGVGGGGGSVTSDELSALTSAHNALSNQVSNLISAGGGGVSVTSNELSIAQAALSARVTSVNTAHDAASNTLSAVIVILGDVASVQSQGFSVLNAFDSNLVSAINVVSNSLSNLLSLHDVLSNRVSANSGTGGAASVTSNELSALLATTQQTYRNGSVYVISAATLSNVPGLSISMAASTMYQIEGALMYECGTSGGFAFGLSLPALAAAGSYVEMWMAATITQATAGAAGTYAAGKVALSAVAAGNTAIVSASIGTLNQARFVKIQGMICTSAAGTAQLMAKSSVAGASMSVRGGYLKAYRIGTI